MKLTTHPLAELIPEMSVEEFEELREDIRANGLREPVTIFEEQILDGRHRARACEEIGVDPPQRQYEGDAPAEFVISLNLRRRHLTTGQRAVAALALLDYERDKAKERLAAAGRKAAPGRPAETSPHLGGGFESRHETEAAAQAGEKLGVSRSSVERAARVAKERPDLHEKVKSGDITVNAAFEATTGRRTKDGTPVTERPAQPPKPGKREAARSSRRLEGLIDTFINSQMLLGETNVEAAIQTIKPEEATKWASQLRRVRTDLSRLITALEQAT